MTATLRTLANNGCEILRIKRIVRTEEVYVEAWHPGQKKIMQIHCRGVMPGEELIARETKGLAQYYAMMEYREEEA